MAVTSRSLVCAAALATLPLVRAQVGWLPVRTLPTDAAMVLDDARGCIVLAGDQIPREDAFVTWEWDHADWRDCTRTGTGAPTAWLSSRMAWEPARRRVLRVASGVIGPVAMETWAYDAGTWTRLQPVVSPPPRVIFALAHDAARQRTVLFGGLDNSTFQPYRNDTWEFDGTTWTQRATPVAPPVRIGAGIAYDEAHQTIVLYGGQAYPSEFADTWLLDASGWRQAATSPVPARSGHAMAYDRASQRVVMFGGAAADTWLWDGSDWTRANTAHPPPAREGPAMATDPQGGVLLYGGYYQRSDLWRFVNGEWYRYHGDRALREQANDQHLIYDLVRERVYWWGNGFSGALETREYDGRWWRDVTAPGLRPSARNAVAVFDLARATTVLFGGIDPTTIASSDETWTFDGTRWTPLGPPVRPPARLGHAMAFDPSSLRVLLFGGVDRPSSSAVVLGDTWVFDGATWQQLATATAPSPRHSAGVTTDTVHGRVVLFGGNAGTLIANRSDETWTFANGAWTRLAPLASPPATAQGTLAFDPVRDRVLLVGRATGDRSATWEFDGATWSQLAVPFVDQAVAALVYDAHLDRVLLKGAFTSFGRNELRALVREPLASAATYGSGCSVAGPPPRLGASSTAYFGNHAFQVEVQGAPNAITLLVLGLSQGAVPIQNCTLLVAPPFDLRAAIANGQGFAPFHQQVPILPALRGVPLFFQAGQFAPLRGSFDYSSGLELRLGD